MGGVMKLVFRVLVVCAFCLIHSVSAEEALNNKEIVVRFYTAAFIDRDLKTAQLYLDDGYIQHNPSVKSGAAAFLEFAKGIHARNPNSKIIIKRVIAENDLVVLHMLNKARPEGPEMAVVDIFRVENGKVIEHWDVKQEVPTIESINGNPFI
jgi:predicted SnoaL-like aldol condensation-catalyzing enzyme